MLLLGTFLLCAFSHANGQFLVEILQPPNRGMRHAVERCEATGANFGPDVATFSFSQHAVGCPLTVDPELACSPVTYDPHINGSSSCSNLFGLVPRGVCNFSEKAYYVQTAKSTLSSQTTLTAIIVYNEKGKPPVDMNGGKFADEVKLPVLMVSYDCMLSMTEKYPPSKGFVVQIKISPGYYDLFRYLIPFVVVVGFCFVVLLVSLAIRLCRERRRIARKRLSKRNLKKIPTKKFRKGDYPETCAICLEDFVEGEKLRVLPCRHTYHCTCIDPWLTQNRKVCPMCKRRVGAKNSDSESSDDERRRHAEHPSTSSASALPPQLAVSEIDEHQNPNFVPAPMQPQPSGSSSVLVEVHHNSHMGSQEQLVDEDFLAQMENQMSEEETEPQESLSQSFRKKIKNIFNRSGHSPLQEEDDDDGGVNHSRVNHSFQGSNLCVADSSVLAQREPQPEAAQKPEGSTSQPGYQFRDPFEHHDHDHDDHPEVPPSTGATDNSQVS